ncbi:MAG: NAD(P)/FAD-dependent oxidoreductase [Clostridiales bacterium]|nr:NAD(P)/FAD-dependent oxidoreductase [Clostridiales bacterium]
MLAALFAAREGAKVTLLERNEKLGKKIYITGKGRCNVTNACDTEEFLRNVPRNPRFLYSALRLLSPDDMLALLAELGCETKIERGRRAFPVSDKASDVTRALEKGMRQAGVEIRLNCRVQKILTEDHRVTGIQLENGQMLPAGAVIVCTGGLSYPSTGSTGDGIRMGEETGHSIIPPRASLAGLLTKEKWPTQLQGLTLKNVCLNAHSCGKIIYSEQGEMLFTHFGISGPLAIELSSHLPEDQPTEVHLDLKPGLTMEQMEQRLMRDFAAAGKKQLSTIMQGLLPQRFAALFPGLCQMDEKMPCNQVSAKQRQHLARMLKFLPLSIAGVRPITEAIVTRGGVDVKALNPATMQSRIVQGLYFAGETIDVDAHTGGYNLQIAFATGALAGKSAARQMNC